MNASLLVKQKSLVSYLLSIFILLLIITATCHAAPKAALWPYWNKSDQESQLIVKHDAWDRILKKYVNTKYADKINRFSYSKVTLADKRNLENYISYLHAIKIRQYNKQEQLVYWINLYNALTVKMGPRPKRGQIYHSFPFKFNTLKTHALAPCFIKEISQ